MATITLTSADGSSVAVGIDGTEQQSGNGTEATRWLRKRGVPQAKAEFEVARAQSMGRATFEADLRKGILAGHP